MSIDFSQTEGVRCGNHPGVKVYHASTDEVRECYEQTRYQEQMQREEQAIEMAYERHLENRGYDAARWDEDRERELAGW